MTDNSPTAAQEARQAPPVSRRRALLGAAIIGAGAAAPAVCVAAEPDGLLIQLESQRVAAQREADEANAAEQAAYARYVANAPERPASIVKQDGDGVLLGFGLGRGGHFTRHDVEALKEERERHNALFEAHGCNRRGVERCDAILEGLATYTAQDDAARKAHDLPAYIAACDAAGNRVGDLEDRIIATPAKGLAGVRIKLALIDRYWPEADRTDYHGEAFASLLADLMPAQSATADVEAELAANTSAGEA